MTVEVRDAVKDFQTPAECIHALRGVSLTVGPGELVAVEGPSGSGKTTLLNAMAGLEELDSGSVTVGRVNVMGLSVAERDALRLSELALIYQDDNLFGDLSAYENIDLVLRAMGLPTAERRRRIVDALHRVALSTLGDRLPREMSGGQRQRVGIARAVAKRAALVLADEPTGALDTRTSREIMGLFQSLAHDGAAVVVVSHDPLVADVATSTHRMVDGCLEAA